MGVRREGNHMVSELEQAAMKGKDMPDGLSMPEQFLFQALSYLYARFRAGQIDRERGGAEKKKIMYQYRMLSEKETASADLANWHARLRKEIESAAIRYRKEPSRQAADDLIKTLDGMI